MGTEPLSGSAGGGGGGGGGAGGRAKSGSRRCTQGDLPSFGPHGCVKPYCCFVVCIVFFGSAECYSTLRQLIRPSVGGLLPLPPPLMLRIGPPFICARGYPQVAT